MSNNEPTGKSEAPSGSRPINSAEFRKQMIEELKAAHRAGAVQLAEGNTIEEPAEKKPA
jgi:hypothetical protein